MPLFDTLLDRLVKFVAGEPRRAPGRDRRVITAPSAEPAAEPAAAAEPEPTPTPTPKSEPAPELEPAAEPEPEPTPAPPVELDPEIESLLIAALSEVPKALAAGIVDIGSSELLGVSTVESQPAAVLELVAAATQDLFSIPHFAAIEGDDDTAVQQMIVLSTNVLHLFVRLDARIVLVIVSRTDGNLGLALTRVRALLQAGG